jgi:GAF domain-containing protein
MCRRKPPDGAERSLQRYLGSMASLLVPKLRSALSVPLFSSGSLAGVLTLYSTSRTGLRHETNRMSLPELISEAAPVPAEVSAASAISRHFRNGVI